MTTRALALILVAAAAPAWGADDDYRDGRIRFTEPGVTLQRASEAGAEEALSNMPFLPGDRVWTDFSGRAEFQFADGSVVRLDTRSKLDYLAHDEGRDGDLVVLSLWSGSVYLHVRNDRGRSDFEVQTPEGRVELREGGMYRVDVDRGELRLSVYEGQAVIDSGRQTETVRRGERAFAMRGEAPSRPEPFDDEREEDAFARWDRDRGDPWAWAGDSRRYLPEEVAPYGADFDAYGTWDNVVEIGYVWRPRVDLGWRPYLHGRWIWTVWGWTWVPYEPWGWAPFHYGRWGWSVGLGWYWIPHRAWGPAWVTWAVGGDHVGWCPLGWRNRPVLVHGHRGHAVPRGGVGPGGSNAWVYARRGDLTARDLARRRVDVEATHAQALRVVDVTRTRLTRELRVVEADSPAAPRGAVPRNVRLRPSPGDTVPELRADPMTTIPDAAARRGRRAGERDGERYERRFDRRTAPAAGDTADTDRAAPRSSPTLRARPDPASADDGADRATDRPARRFTPDRQPPEWRQRPRPDDTERARPVRPPEAAPPALEREGRDTDGGAVRRETERTPRETRDDGDVLRRFFRPLSGSRERDESDRRERAQPRERGEDRRAPRARERDDEPASRAPSDSGRSSWRPRGEGSRGGSDRSAPRAEPRAPRPAPQAGRRGGGDGAARRQPKDKD